MGLQESLSKSCSHTVRFKDTMVALSRSCLTKSTFGGLLLSPPMDSLSKISFTNGTFCRVSIIIMIKITYQV